MLGKTLDALRSCQDKTVSYLAELKAKVAESGLKEEKIAYYKDMSDRLLERVKYLESIKCNELSLIKIGFIKIYSSKKCL